MIHTDGTAGPPDLAPITRRRKITDPRDIPLLVLSFDKYEDLWDPFFTFFHRHWPDCPFRIYLGTNFKTYPDQRVTTLHAGAEVTWGTRVHRLLEQLDSEYVLLFLEDFLVEERVDCAEVLRLGRVAIEEQLGCLRLAPNPAPSRPVYGHKDLGWLLPGDPYLASSQVSFWHTDTLLEMLKPEYSIWDFEFKGSLAGRAPSRPLWATWRPAIRYQHCVEQGMWLPWGIRKCLAAGITPDLNVRKAMRGNALLQRYIGAVKGFLYFHMPRSLQRARWLRIAERETGLGARRLPPAAPSSPPAKAKR